MIGTAGSAVYCDRPSADTKSVNVSWGCTEEKSKWSFWVEINIGKEKVDGEKSMDAESSLTSSSWESNILDRLLVSLLFMLLVLAAVVVAVIVVMVLAVVVVGVVLL
jgi:hypothetical protein